VSPKNLVLVAAAVAVMAMGVYLFIQVKATPAQAHSSTTTTARPSPVAERTPDRVNEPAPAPTPSVATPAPSPGTAGRPNAVRVGNDIAAQAAPSDDERANPRLDSMMELASKAYDSQEFDQATAIAGKVLSKDPTNVKMLRIMVSANCIAGDSGLAQQYFDKLPKFDRDQMKARCDRYGVTFKDPAQ
jgi:hypothetical protein